MAEVAPADLEQGKGSTQQETPDAPKEEFNQWYYIVYAFSMIVMVIGVLAYFFGGGGLAQGITSTLLLIVGIYLPLQADLVVTYFRLMKETQRFKQNNKRFKGGLRRQETEIRKLKKAKDAFEKLDKQFGGSLDRAAEELQELQATARDRIQQSSNALLSMYSANKDRIIVAGEKLDDAFVMLSSLYCRIYPKFFKRMEEMRKGIEQSPRFQKEQGLTPTRFSKCFEVSLSEDKIENIVDKVKIVMAEKGRATIEKEFEQGGGNFGF